MSRTSNPIADFRSDTVTRPSRAMYEAMAAAPLGDDVLGDDPTVLELQEYVADLLGKENGLFVPSGTMSNLIAIFLHVKPGEELLCEENSHILIYEQAGYAQINQVSVRSIPSERGVFDAARLKTMFRDDNLHFPQTKMLSLENTHNRGGGTVWPYNTLLDVCRTAKEARLTLHLDGARLMNAQAASGRTAKEIAAPFDTVSLCFSKGLGAPVGSILVGSRDHIRAGLRRRKVLGGGLRQVGVLAAAALFAMKHHTARLTEDHELAQWIATQLAEIGPEHLRLKYDTIDTNMVFCEITSERIVAVAKTAGTTPAGWFAGKLAEKGVLVLPTGPATIRIVTHRDVNMEDGRRLIDLAAVLATLNSR